MSLGGPLKYRLSAEPLYYGVLVDRVDRARARETVHTDGNTSPNTTS